MSDKRTPSLLEPESRGGDTAGRGFDFQDNFLVSQIPRWLERDGFTSMMQEAIGDIEVKIYVPGYGECIEMIEAKDFRLTPATFWKEIGQFYAANQGSPNTFRWFRLVAPAISEEIAPFQHGLRRIQSPYGFYPENSGVIQNSLADFAQLVERANQPPEYADFLFRHVLIETEYGTVQELGEALFKLHFGEIPEYRHLPNPVLSSIYVALLKLVSPRNTPITRKMIEEKIRACIPPDQLPPYTPVRLYTAHLEDSVERKELYLDWVEFFGGSTRSYPEAEQWNVGLVSQLIEVKEFILNHRSIRHLSVTGSRRLSATLALGSVFSATSGFIVEMEHREGIIWVTNDHAGSDDIVPLNIGLPHGQSEQLVVSLGIPNDIRQAVENYAQKMGAGHLPFLNISYSHPVENARQANSIVAQTKTAILQSLSHSGATYIHLFCAVPSFIALLLGHRLNATSPVQCYEYISPNTYVPTCVLNL